MQLRQKDELRGHPRALGQQGEKCQVLGWNAAPGVTFPVGL